MASITNNPYKRFKKSLKGSKLNGEAVHALMKRKSSNWIAGAIKKPGALHKELGIKAGNKIPAKTLAHAAEKGGKEGQRARLAETLKGFHKKGKHMKKKGSKKYPTTDMDRGDVEHKKSKRHKKAKKMAALPPGKAYGTPLPVPKAMQTAKNPAWVKGKKRKSVVSMDGDKEMKNSKRRKDAMCMKCKAAHEKHEKHSGKA